MDGERFTPGSGNAYRDLGYDDPEGMSEKAGLVMALSEVMARDGMTDAQLASVIGLTPARVHDLVRGQFSKTRVADIACYLATLEKHIATRQ